MMAKQVKNFGLIKQHGVTPSIKVALRATKEQVDAKGAHFAGNYNSRKNLLQKFYWRNFTAESLVGKNYCSSFTGEILPQNL